MADNDTPGPAAVSGVDTRLSRLEAQVATLAEAVRALARGLEAVPSQETSPQEPARGARLAHEILLAKGL
ncbi:hypothetical protein [Streptomyces sp. HPF1205]|uniref:hypothetical protein n=1 Tax=Streptomyces sp. HPF1205 TaxID=2873262 RepID=UPI001CECB396|nr:hypothetical protein [Streptomyces sp. HPF1205]